MNKDNPVPPSTLIGAAGEVSDLVVPLDLPEREIATIYKDHVLPGIDDKSPKTEGSEHIGLTAPLTDFDPAATDYRRSDSNTNAAMLLEDRKPFRRVVSLLGIGLAAQCEVAHREDFSDHAFIGAGVLPVDLPLAENERLWFRQVTGVVQSIDWVVEPRGPGR